MLGTTTIEQSLGSSTTAEMGRRKLPTLPQHPTTGVQPTSASSLYYSSSTPIPPERRDIGVGQSSTNDLYSSSNIRFDASTSAASRLIQQHQYPPVLQQKRDLNYASAYYRQPTSHPIDPAIFPGAQFRTSQQQTSSQRPRQAIIGAAKSAPVSPKLSETMSQLIFKQELRQALCRRYNQSVEIEANRREFLIRKMLNSGLIPSECRREIDAVPQVTKCDLPYELIAGARIVPPDFYSRRPQYGRAHQQTTDQWTMPHHVSFDHPVVTQKTYIPPSPGRRSVGCQYDLPSSTPTKRYDGYTSIAASYTSPVCSSPYAQRRSYVVPKVDSSTQTMVDSSAFLKVFLKSCLK